MVGRGAHCRQPRVHWFRQSQGKFASSPGLLVSFRPSRNPFVVIKTISNCLRYLLVNADENQKCPSVAFLLLAALNLLPQMKNNAERRIGWPARQTEKKLLANTVKIMGGKR